MIDWNEIDTSKTELRIINSIAKRCWKNHTNLNFTSLQMDNDISGIQAHINRETGKIENCFSPRYSVR